MSDPALVAVGTKGQSPRMYMAGTVADVALQLKPGEVAIAIDAAPNGPAIIKEDGSGLLLKLIADTPAVAQREGLAAIDTAALALSSAVLTQGHHKAQIYQDKAAEVLAYRSLKGAVLTLTTAQSAFPTLMAMVSVWQPEATTAAAKLAVLADIVAKVSAGIDHSRPYLRTIDAIAVHAKEQLKGASTVADKRAITFAAIARLNAFPTP